jgi:hypothetical protein
MDETKLYSWFLGPKAENADMLERLILEPLRDCVFWSQGGSCLDEHLTALGISTEEFEKVGRVKTLRSAVTSPWLALSRGANPDYSAAFAAALKQVILSSIGG